MPTAPKPFRPLYAQGDKKAQAKRYDSTPQRRADRLFYGSARWQQLRLLVLQRDPCCLLCEMEGRTSVATIADHIIERTERPDLQWDLDNLRGVCVACHNRRHKSRT